MKLEKGMKVLFEGDSVTDAGRDYQDEHSWAGYMALCARTLAAHGVDSYNRAISGSRTIDLLARFENSCREVRPDAVSILIGINDTWRRYDSNDSTSAHAFEKNLRMILDIARSFTDNILIMEPFLLPTDPEKLCFREDLNPKIDVVRKLAVAYAREFVPLDGIFAERTVHAPAARFSADGVHPLAEGQAVIAEAWLDRISY